MRKKMKALFSMLVLSVLTTPSWADELKEGWYFDEENKTALWRWENNWEPIKIQCDETKGPSLYKKMWTKDMPNGEKATKAHGLCNIAFRHNETQKEIEKILICAYGVYIGDGNYYVDNDPPSDKDIAYTFMVDGPGRQRLVYLFGRTADENSTAQMVYGKVADYDEEGKITSVEDYQTTLIRTDKNIWMMAVPKKGGNSLFGLISGKLVPVKNAPAS